MHTPAKTTPRIAILGAGLAGMLLSLLLSRRGLAHDVIARPDDGKRLDLGETLPPSTLELLSELDLLELFSGHAQRCFGYHALWGSDELSTVDFFGRAPMGYGLKLKKWALVRDLRHRQAAQIRTIEGGLRIEPRSSLTKLWFTSGGVDSSLECDLVIDATGRSRRVARSFGVGSLVIDQQLGFSCIVRRVRLPGLRYHVFTERFQDGWGMISALDKCTSALSLFTPADSKIIGQIRNYGAWSSLLAGTQLLRGFLTESVSGQPRGALANTSRAAKISEARWLAIGDAAMAFDPLSSHGVSNVLFTATAAAEAIQTWHTERSPRALRAYGERLERIFGEFVDQRARYYSTRRAAHQPLADISEFGL